MRRGAQTSIVAAPTGTRVGGGHNPGFGRPNCGAFCPMEFQAVGFHDMAQRLSGRSGPLQKLVQEEHTAIGLGPCARLVFPQPGGPDISTGKRCLAAMASQDLAWPSPSMSSQPWSSLGGFGFTNALQEGVESTNSRRVEISQRPLSPWRSDRNLSPPGAWTRRWTSDGTTV